MGGFGWQNGFPFEFGGGSTSTETIYSAMRSSVGVGGSALDDDGTIDGLWRQARASGLAAAATTGERAILQAFPGHSIDLLEYYEALLQSVPEPDDSLVERQAAVEQLWTERVRASLPDIAADLVAIDARFSVAAFAHASTTDTLLGRAFEDLAGALPFGGGRKSTRFANYSTEFVVTVLFDIGSGVAPSLVEQRLIERARAHLNKVLPATHTFQVLTGVGFILDVDLLDLTGLNP
jgi:hypothetical protein